MPVDPLNLPGRWALNRDIEDRLGDDVAASGVAEFTELPDGRIRWHESGTMHHTSLDLPFTRVMYMRRASGATMSDGWEVTFEDGRPFHPWPASSGAERADGAEGDHQASGMDVVHVCTPDLYRGTFVTAPSEDEWTLRWQVTGPRKDYVMITRYTRL
jgi:hypothetical protein